VTTTEPRQSDARPTASAKKIAWSAAAAFAIATLILVSAVLPAEYGIDLLGTGRALGLIGLAETATPAIARQEAGYKTDRVEFVLGPYQSVEYKYRIEEGASMLYSWRATRSVMYDFHSEPDGAPEGYAESFDKDERAEAHGTFAAPFGGVHGWYWENGGGGEVTITLVTAGFYSQPQEFFDGRQFFRELEEPDDQ
jgi:hypothetical protein